MKKIFVILSIMIISIGLISCSKKEENKNKDNIPDQLKTISENNNKIMKDVEKIMSLMVNPIQTDISQEQLSSDKNGSGSSPSDKQGDKDESKDSQGSDEQSSDSEDESNPETAGENQDKEIDNTIAQIIMKMWLEISDTCKEMHGNWNDYELDTLKDGIKKESIEKLEVSMNGLTVGIDKKDLLDILYKANDVNMSLADFYDLYKGNIEGEKNRINYCIRGSYLYAVENDWKTSTDTLNQVDEYVTQLKDKIITDEKNSKHIKKLVVSINDMKMSLSNKNRELLLIKRDIVLDNLFGIIQGTKKSEDK